MFFQIFTTLLTVQVITAKAENWCDPTLCRGSSKHIACNNNGKFASSCVNAVNVEITKELIELILKTHNSLRNNLASGEQSPFKPAAKMPTLTWNPTLAQHATLNTKQCKMAHDSCRNTFDFKYAGQNLAGRGSSAATEPAMTAIPSMINSWYNEYKYATPSQMEKLSNMNGKGGNAIGHFTQIAQDRSNQVGCGLSIYKSGGFYWNLLACNYARTNMMNQPVYVASEVAGSGCSSGTNPTYPALCNANEVVNPNY